MNKNAWIRIDNALLRIGLVRLKHYTDAMAQAQRAETLLAERTCHEDWGPTIPVYTLPREQ